MTGSRERILTCLLYTSFLDSFLTVSAVPEDKVEYVLDKLAETSEKYGVNFVLSISIDAEDLPEKYKENIIISL